MGTGDLLPIRERLEEQLGNRPFIGITSEQLDQTVLPEPGATSPEVLAPGLQEPNVNAPNGLVGPELPAPKKVSRFRQFLGEFLQNFGAGLQAAGKSRTRGFAAAFGGAAGAPQVRREREFERAAQLRREQAVKKAEFDRGQRAQAQIDIRRQEVEETAESRRREFAALQGRFEEERKDRRFREIVARETRKQERFEAGVETGRRERREERLIGEARVAERDLKLEIIGEQRKGLGKEILTAKDILIQSRLNVQLLLKSEEFFNPADKTIVGAEATAEAMRVEAIRLSKEFNITVSAADLRTFLPRPNVFGPAIQEFQKILLAGDATKEELLEQVAIRRDEGEYSEAEANLIAVGAELIEGPKITKKEEFERKVEKRRFQKRQTTQETIRRFGKVRVP